MNTQYRYEIGIEDIEAYDNVSKFSEACMVAHALKDANREETIYIFDRMAHVGKTELWFVIGGDLIVQRIKKVQS